MQTGHTKKLSSLLLCLASSIGLFAITPAATADESVYQSVVTIDIDRPLSPTAVQSVCSGIYKGLAIDAHQSLDISVDNPFQCKSQGSNGDKQLIVTTYTTIDTD